MACANSILKRSGLARGQTETLTEHADRVEELHFDRRAEEAYRALTSLAELKELAHRLPADHPFRIVVLADSDQMPAGEYASKLVGWFRLLQISRSP